MNTAQQQSVLFQALGHPIRLQILEILSQSPSCVCDLVARTGKRQPYISQHLSVLRNAGLVVAERQAAKYICYHLNRAGISALEQHIAALLPAGVPPAHQPEGICTMTIDELREYGQQMAASLQLSGHVVGVRLLPHGAAQPADAISLTQHRYCQALMKARRGQSVTLDGAGIACPAAAAAFGFRPLPEGLRNGGGLVGFGIVADESIGRRMFQEMPTLPDGQIGSLHVFPLVQATALPDVIVIEDEVEKLMWVNLAYLNAVGGERLHASTAILQATCVDSTIIPFQEQRLNFGFGCYGCREATDLGSSESVVGFPAAILPALVKNLAYLAQKAIPNSRSKRALAALQRHIG